MGTRVVTVNDVLDGHVALDIECLDRIYLDGYVPSLQSSGQVVAFLCQQLGYPFPSPALFDKVVVNVFSKHSRSKQDLKDGRALRIQTVVNAPRDLGCNARLPNLDQLQANARAGNRRILDAQAGRPGPGACQSSRCAERAPTVDAAGWRTRRFGSAILGSWPWSAPWAPPCWRRPAVPTSACVPWWLSCSALPTAQGR
jgi:hypothetical protein